MYIEDIDLKLNMNEIKSMRKYALQNKVKIAVEKAALGYLNDKKKKRDKIE